MKYKCFMPYVKCPYRSKGSCSQLHNRDSNSSCYKYYFNVGNTEDIPQNEYIIDEFYRIDSILKKYDMNPYTVGNMIAFDNWVYDKGIYDKHYIIHNNDFDYDIDIDIEFDYINGVNSIYVSVDGTDSKIMGNQVTPIINMKIDRIEKLLEKFLNLKTEEDHTNFALKEFGIKNDGYFI